MRGFMHEFAFRSVVPCMERKIRSLYATIVEQRKGFGNSLKSWFGGAQKAERVGVTIYAGNTPPAYTCVALESQIRLSIAIETRDRDRAGGWGLDHESRSQIARSRRNSCFLLEIAMVIISLVRALLAGRTWALLALGDAAGLRRQPIPFAWQSGPVVACESRARTTSSYHTRTRQP